MMLRALKAAPSLALALMLAFSASAQTSIPLPNLTQNGSPVGTDLIPDEAQGSLNLGWITLSQIAGFTAGQIVSGSPTTGHCASWVAGGKLQDFGSPCGGVMSLDGRTGAVTLASGDITTALGFTPANASGTASLSAAQTFPALQTFGSGLVMTPGSTPSSPVNGQCWTTSAGVFCQVNGTSVSLGTVSGAAVTSVDGQTGAVTLGSSDITTALGFTPANASGVALIGSSNTFGPQQYFSGGADATTIASDHAVRLRGDSVGGPAILQATDHGVTAQWCVLSFTPNVANFTAGCVPQVAGTAIVLTNDPRFGGVIQNSQSAGYTLAASDAGGEVYHPASDTTARTWTIPANASVGLAVGTKVDILNDCGAGALTISITSDTLVMIPSGLSGSRTLASCGEATLTKVGTTRWVIVGTGLS